MASNFENIALFDDDEEDVELSATPALLDEIRNAVVFNLDWSVGSLLDQLRADSIDLQPQFQRRDAWTIGKKSRLVESLILGLPVPQIVLAERPDIRGTFIVLDGKQRLTALMQFVGGMPASNWNAFSLRELFILRELNGTNFTGMSENPAMKSHLAAFMNQPIRTIILRGWKSEDLLHLVFHRLNSNVVPLSPQELRQALIRGPFLKFLNDFSADSAVLQGVLKSSGPDFRMRDSEVYLRLLAFSLFASEYRGNLRAFLDAAARRINQNWDSQETEVVSRLREIEMRIGLWAVALGSSDKVGRRYRAGVIEPRLNRAVLDAQVSAAADSRVSAALASTPELVATAFQEIFKKDVDFVRSIESTTKTIDAVRYRSDALVSAIVEAARAR